MTDNADHATRHAKSDFEKSTKNLHGYFYLYIPRK